MFYRNCGASLDAKDCRLKNLKIGIDGTAGDLVD